MPSSLRTRVLLTGAERFVPQAPDGAEIVGVVQSGQQTGALARLADGQYVQVNGSIVRPLNASRIERALRQAKGRRPRVSLPRADAQAKPAVVTVRRRRIIDPALKAGGSPGGEPR